MLPVMQRTLSDSFPTDIPMDHNYVPPKSRISLVQSAIRAFLINVQNHNKNHRVRLFLFNHHTEMVQGSIHELQQRMDSIYADNGTDMILCFQKMKSAYELLAPEEKENILCSILTDGMHNTHNDLSVHINDVIADSFYNHLFSSIIGIGNRTTVDYDVLTKLTGGRPDVFQLVSEEQEVFDAMNGSFFDMLTSRVTDATFSVMCRNDETLVHMANVKKTFYTVEEYQEWQSLACVRTNCNFMQLSHFNNTFLLEYKDPPVLEEKEPENVAQNVDQNVAQNVDQNVAQNVDQNVAREFWIGVDVSGSMDTPVTGIEPSQVVHHNVSEQKSVDTDPYVEVMMSVSSISEHTRLLGCGAIQGASIQYIHPKTKMSTIESIPCHELLETSIVMEFVKKIVSLSDILTKVMKKKQVQSLYQDHLYIPQLVDSDELPNWLRVQGKVVWKNLKQRFISTLSNGERFFHQTPIAYDMMLRAMSSHASTQSATPFSDGSPVHVEETVPFDEINKCKLCFVNTINVLFPDCRHAGLCKECYTMYLNSTGKDDCPFCRKKVSSWSTIEVNNTKNGYCQEQGCYQHCDYVGHGLNKDGEEICGHLLYCKSCKKKNKTEDGVVCQQCKNEVHTVRIYFC